MPAGSLLLDYQACSYEARTLYLVDEYDIGLFFFLFLTASAEASTSSQEDKIQGIHGCPAEGLIRRLENEPLSCCRGIAETVPASSYTVVSDHICEICLSYLYVLYTLCKVCVCSRNP